MNAAARPASQDHRERPSDATSWPRYPSSARWSTAVPDAGPSTMRRARASSSRSEARGGGPGDLAAGAGPGKGGGRDSADVSNVEVERAGRMWLYYSVNFRDWV